MMNTRKVTKKEEIEILTLFYNGFTNMQKIGNIVGYSLPTISRVIGQSFEDGVNLNKGLLILESKINNPPHSNVVDNSK
jgi:hypothetical protein